MSVEAMRWVLNDACWIDEHGGMWDVPPHLVPLLQSLANQADDQGKGAYPSQATMAWNCRKSERGIRKDLALALERRLIRVGDQRLVDHIPADARPVVYDLAMDQCRPPRPGGRNRSTSRQDGGSGTVVPLPAGHGIPDSQKGPEPQDRPEPAFPPEPQDRNHSSPRNQAPSRGRNHRTGRSVPAGTTGPTEPDNSAGTPVPAGTGVPPTQMMMTSSSSSAEPRFRPEPQDRPSSSAERERLARAIVVIRSNTDADVDEAAALADSVRRQYGVHPGMLGAYLRTMAGNGDLDAALAEHRAGDVRHAPDQPTSLIALSQRADAAAQRDAQAANAVRGEARRARHSEVLSQIRPTRRTKAPPAGGPGPGPPATAAS